MAAIESIASEVEAGAVTRRGFVTTEKYSQRIWEVTYKETAGSCAASSNPRDFTWYAE